MKKLYRKGTVHPTTAFSDQLLSFLPAAILTLTAALSPGEKEVLAYLIYSCSSANFSSSHRSTGGPRGGADDHAPCFNCNCFRCYMTYWVKWDTSPNRQLIHEIIDAFEDSLLKESRKEKNKKDRRKGKSVRGNVNISVGLDEVKRPEISLTKEELGFGEPNAAAEEEDGGESGGDGGDDVEDCTDGDEVEKGSVRRFVSFLGERIWSVWG